MADPEDPAEAAYPGVASKDPAYPGVVAADPTYPGVAADPTYPGVAADPTEAPYPEELAEPMEPAEKGPLEQDGKTGWFSPTFLPFFGLGSPLGLRSFDIRAVEVLGLGEVYPFSSSASFDPGLISVISSSSSSPSRVDRSAPLLPHDLLPPADFFCNEFRNRIFF